LIATNSRKQLASIIESQTNQYLGLEPPGRRFVKTKVEADMIGHLVARIDT